LSALLINQHIQTHKVNLLSSFHPPPEFCAVGEKLIAFLRLGTIGGLFRQKYGQDKMLFLGWGKQVGLWAAVFLLCPAMPAMPAQTGLGAALGKTYPIAERDFLDVIRERLQAKQDSGELAAMQKAMVDTAKHTIENPLPVPGIARATKAETHYYDPSVTAPNDIRDADGDVVVKAGTSVNPLEYVGLSKVLLFIDAADGQQVSYAAQYYKDSKKPVKVILTGGSYMALMRQWKRPVYFDQGGYLTGRLRITQVPTLVYQETPVATELRIDTVALPDGGGKP
jgi:conjugal transfer pilus assembly protein TraW